MADEPSREALAAGYALRQQIDLYLHGQITLAAQQEVEAQFARALDEFARAAVEREREQSRTFLATMGEIRSGIFYWMTRNHHRNEKSYSILGDVKERLTQAIKLYEGKPHDR